MNSKTTRHFIGTILVGMIAEYFLVSDLDFGRHARSAIGTVKNWTPGYRGAPGSADVEYLIDGRIVVAGLKIWSGRPQIGQRLPIRYLPDDPTHVVLGTFGYLYFSSVITLSFFVVVAWGEWKALVSRVGRSG